MSAPTCTCLHPGWPETPCALHPDRRPKTQEEKIAFRKDWDARVVPSPGTGGLR